MSLEIKHLYEFGEFRLDTQEKILMRGDQPVALTPKVFELLSVFVENYGRLLGKDELMKKIWADSFVEEGNLTFNIRQLRIALGDDAQRPIYIKTVPRHGYRFIAAVKEIVESDAPIIVEEKSPAIDSATDIEEIPTIENIEKKPKSFAELDKKHNSRWFSKPYLPIAALIILLITSLASALIWSRNQTNSQMNAPILEAEFKSEQLTNAGGVYRAVISPDGKRMAYLNEIGNRTGIWLKQFETGESTQIVQDTDDAYYGLAFSNDNQELYFSRGPKTDEARKIDVYRVSVLGGVPKEVVSRVEGLFSLSPDDRQISFVRCSRQEQDFCSLFIAEVNSKNETKLLTRPRPILMRDNQFSPDGKSIAVAAGQSRTSSSEFGLIEVDVATKTEREITDHKFSSIKYLRWLPDQSAILLTGFEPPNNSVKIFKVSTKTDEIKVLTGDSSITYECISLDKEAKRLVTTQIAGNFKLWLAAAVEPNAAKPISQAAEAMYFGQSVMIFSPSGKKILYASAADVNQQIWIMNADGTNQRQLTSSRGTNWQPRFAPDESYVLFASTRTGEAQIWRMNIDGTDQTQISEDAGSRPILVSSDGRTIYYESPKTSNLKKISIGDDGKSTSTIVSDERMFQPEISPDEKTVAYFSRQPNQPFQIALMSLADGKILKYFSIADEKSLPVKIVWSPDGQFLFYLCEGDKKNVVWRLSSETGKSEIFVDLGADEVSDISFSPDGKSFAFVRGKALHDAFLLEGLK
jgi:Tol biopolymer transport system component/DNA-binding winged helix-turn-helix (wHTH) protein